MCVLSFLCRVLSYIMGKILPFRSRTGENCQRCFQWHSIWKMYII